MDSVYKAINILALGCETRLVNGTCIVVKNSRTPLSCIQDCMNMTGEWLTRTMKIVFHCDVAQAKI